MGSYSPSAQLKFTLNVNNIADTVYYPSSYARTLGGAGFAACDHAAHAVPVPLGAAMNTTRPRASVPFHFRGPVRGLAVVAAALLTSAPAFAHEIWFAPRSAKLALVYGTGAEDLDPVKRLPMFHSAVGFDAAGKPVPVSLKATDSLVVVDTAGDPAVVAAQMDNGVWTKPPVGEWVAKGKNEVPNAVASGHYYKYATYLRKLPAGPVAPLPGMKLQLVPVSKVFPKKMGQKLTVQVLFDGKPLAGARVFQEMVTAPAGAPQLTDQDGRATITVRNDGLNVIMAQHMSAPEDPVTTFMTEHVATLSVRLRSAGGIAAHGNLLAATRAWLLSCRRPTSRTASTAGSAA